MSFSLKGIHDDLEFLLEEDLSSINLCALHCELRNTYQLLASLGCMPTKCGPWKNAMQNWQIMALNFTRGSGNCCWEAQHSSNFIFRLTMLFFTALLSTAQQCKVPRTITYFDFCPIFTFWVIIHKSYK